MVRIDPQPEQTFLAYRGGEKRRDISVGPSERAGLPKADREYIVLRVSSNSPRGVTTVLDNDGKYEGRDALEMGDGKRPPQ